MLSLRVRCAASHFTLWIFLCVSAIVGRATDSHTCGHSVATSKRPLNVADAVEMTKPGDASYMGNWTMSTNPVVFSPDNHRFAFLTQKADLKDNVITYSIWIFDTTTALTAPKPTRVATLTSSSNRPAISNLKWLPDNDTLVFLGEQPRENPQLYKVRCSTRNLEKLTDQLTTIVAFSISDDAGSFVYLAHIPAEPMFSDEVRRRGFFVTPGHKWQDLYLNKREFDYRRNLYIKTPKMSVPQRLGETLQVPEYDDLTISPDGMHAFLQIYDTNPPSSWDDYSFQSDGAFTFDRSLCLAGTIERCAGHYLLVDLHQKSVRPLVNAPIAYKYEGSELAAWTADNSVLLVNALLPLDGATEDERNRRKRNVYAAEVTFPGGAIHQFDERENVRPASNIRPDPPNRRIVTTVSTYGTPLEYRKVDGEWKIKELSPSDAELSFPLAVTLDEDINTPPRLVAIDAKTKRKTLLLDLNPQFTHLAFGRVELFLWKNREGKPSGGQLYYPTDYVAGKRYPLVIQAHGESRERFWVDGPFSTTNAAQALANRGFFVLQMGFGDRYDKTSLDEAGKIMDTPEESPRFMSYVESAIDQLDQRGLIDRTHIGLSGFSRTVYEGEYFLTHSGYPIGAAVMADGPDYGYPNCIYFFVPMLTSDCEKMNGGVPWGNSFSNWVKESPPMRLDKVHTPVLLQSIGGPLNEWEIYAGLRWLKKPVELLNFYPEGEHVLVRPQQVYLSEQSAVDWYCFWLKGEEDPDPAKAEQYKRWRSLRPPPSSQEDKSQSAD